MLLSDGAGKPEEARVVDGSTTRVDVFDGLDVLDVMMAGSVTVTMLEVEVMIDVEAEDVLFCASGLEPLTGEVSFDGGPGKLLLPAGKPGNELLPAGKPGNELLPLGAVLL